ncbi:hypothetical protein F4779DRAFT_37144 [Xylariaceae sp. FL0662B]|nr:hypothetical protein F4779DRAFT_37144 [Xylariaceae sp. FL0662B]
MGHRDQATVRSAKSDSGFGDDVSEPAHDCPETTHPLTLKGYEIGPASKLQIGDVFEFLWADASEFEWEWKCLGYTRFIVLRHGETFPHHCVCIPISTGGKREFAKPGIDSYQQGYVFATGEPTPSSEQPQGGPKLPYSPVGIELRPGKLRIKEDSRANYADIIEIDHDAQVMVIGDVARYFDRVRRNVNKAYMRQILRKALEEYRASKVGHPQAEDQDYDDAKIHSADGDDASVDIDQSDVGHADDFSEQETVMPEPVRREPVRQEPTRRESVKQELSRRESVKRSKEDQRLPRSSISHRQSISQSVKSIESRTNDSRSDLDYDNKSMHNVALAGLK